MNESGNFLEEASGKGGLQKASFSGGTRRPPLRWKVTSVYGQSPRTTVQTTPFPGNRRGHREASSSSTECSRSAPQKTG